MVYYYSRASKIHTPHPEMVAKQQKSTNKENNEKNMHTYLDAQLQHNIWNAVKSK